MQFTISPIALSQRIKNLARVINAKNALPILDTIRFSINDGYLTLVASDSEVTLTTNMPVSDADENGTFCLDAKTLQKSLNELNNDLVTFHVTDNYFTTINYATGKSNFAGQSADEYPITPSVNNDNHEQIKTITLPVADFSKNLSLCSSSVASDELRPQMCGVYFDAAPAEGNPDKRLTLVASDGHRLMRVICKDVPANANAFILSPKVINTLKSIIANATDTIEVTVTEHTAQISTPDYTLDCRLIEGRYPNYNSVIPTNNEFQMSVNSQALIAAIRRVLVFGSITSGLLRFDISENGLKVSAQDIDFNTSAEEHLKCEYNGSPIAIGFNGTFTLNILSGLAANEVTFHISDPSRAAIITPVVEDPEGESYDYTALLMPMLLS